MTERKKKIPYRREKTLIYWFFGFVSLFLIIAQITNTIKKEEKLYDDFGSYLGRYQFESVSGKMKQKVGDNVAISLGDGKLILRIDKEDREYLLTRVSGDEFEVSTVKIGVIFKRDPGGNVSEVDSKPNGLGISFTILKN